jgi:aminopeptidase
MLRDPRLAKLADVLVNYSVGVKKGDLVAVSGDPIGLPLGEEIFRAVIQAGGNAFYWPRSDALSEVLVAHGSDEQIAFSNPVGLDMLERINVSLAWWADSNTKWMSRYPTAKAALLQQARKPFLSRFMQLEAAKKIRWCGTEFPTHAQAMDAEMSLTQWAEFVFRAGLLHLPDPIGAWRQIEQTQQRVCGYLQTKRELHITVPPHNGHDGTDLRVDISRGIWQNCCGHANFPDGEVFCGPTLPDHADGPGFGVEGHVNYTFPAVYMGREVHNVRLKFKAGRVVDATATKGEDFLHTMLDQDAGARNLGEIAIGTNYAITDFSRNILFDEKIGGTFHAAVGAGYPKSGSTNSSGLHWDMIGELRQRTSQGVVSPGGEIRADGEVFHRHGRFLNSSFPQPA